MCELLVGLPDVNVIGVGDWPMWLQIWITTRAERPPCPGCGGVVWQHDRIEVELVDLPCFGRRTRLVWSKQRWRCPNRVCSVVTFVETDDRIADSRAAITDRAGRWATFQVGHHGRAVSEVAADLGCDWHTVMDAVVAHGRPLIEDPNRIGTTTAVGLDEVLFCRLGRFRHRVWSTQIVDVARGQLLDVVAGRDAASACAWFAQRPEQWCDAIEWATLDLSGPYRAVFDTMLPTATQIADPFHLVKLANFVLDETRRRVQNETLGHRGRKDDPLYRIRKLMTIAHERLDDESDAKLRGLLQAGDPRGEVRMAWHSKEVVRSIYEITDPELAVEFVAQLGIDLQDDSCPPEVRRLGRTITRWRDQISAWHRARFTNGPTEARQQPGEAGQARRVRDHELDQLPHPRPALRRPSQLVAPDHQLTLRSEDPEKPTDRHPRTLRQPPQRTHQLNQARTRTSPHPIDARRLGPSPCLRTPGP